MTVCLGSGPSRKRTCARFGCTATAFQEPPFVSKMGSGDVSLCVLRLRSLHSTFVCNAWMLASSIQITVGGNELPQNKS